MVIEAVEPTVHEKIEVALKEFFNDFKCQKCGKCCQEGKGIALWRHESNRLRRIEPRLIRHTFMINGWSLLKLPCVFYNNRKKKCKIYDQRPIACKLYPTAVELDGSLKISKQCPAVKTE